MQGVAVWHSMHSNSPKPIVRPSQWHNSEDDDADAVPTVSMQRSEEKEGERVEGRKRNNIEGQRP